MCDKISIKSYPIIAYNHFIRFRYCSELVKQNNWYIRKKSIPAETDGRTHPAAGLEMNFVHGQPQLFFFINFTPCEKV